MLRNVELVSYLPPFMQDFKELRSALESENIEFSLVWNAADKALSNEFISTADEYGISRFEKMLGISPLPEDSLENRRRRVQTQWLNNVPCTMKGLIKKLIVLCGDADFTITEKFINYLIEIEVKRQGAFFGNPEELDNLMYKMLPCNMLYGFCLSTELPVSINFEADYYSSNIPHCGQFSCGQIPF